MMNKIPNSQLIESDLPTRRAGWKKIQPFALTFNGYEHWGSFKKCREVAHQGVSLFQSKKDLNLTLTDLRTCLFYEARRWSHFKKNPNKRGMEYIHTLVDGIRTRVHSKDFG